MKLTFTAPCTIKAEAGALEKGTIVMQPAYSGGALSLSGWDHPAVVDLASIRAAADLIPCRVGHGDLETDVLGQLAISVDKSGVNAVGRVTNRESAGPKAVLSMAAAGHQFQASIGGDPARKNFIPAGQEIEMNGRVFPGPVYACYDTILGEISVVSLGADATTSTTIAAKAAKGKAIMAEEKKENEKPDFTAFCKAAGFDPATMNDEQKAGMTALHAKLCASDDPEKKEGDDAKKEDKEEEKKAEAARQQATIQANAHATASIKAEAAALRRAGSIKAKCGEHFDIAADAMEGNWDDGRIAAAIELKELRAGRASNKAPVGHIAGKHVTMSRAIEARFLLAGSMNEDRLVKDLGEPNVVHARHALGGYGLCDTLRLLASATGHQLPIGRGEDFLHALVTIAAKSPCPSYHERMSIQADGGASPLSLPGLLSNVAHKLLLEGYNYTDLAWRTISKQGTLQDFKPHNRFRLTNDFRFQPLNADGELQHGKVGEQAYIVQGDTEGLMFNLDRKLIINDDMSAFSELPKAMGRGAGLAINKKFWTLFLSNPNVSTKFNTNGTDGLDSTAAVQFFSTANSNYLSGTTVGTNDSRLNVEGLSRAYTTALQQTDPAGYPLGMEPTLLLVPASLRYTAESLMISRILVSSVSTGATNNNLQPSENPLAGKFRVVATPYLDNSSINGYSTTAWYLLLDPNAGFPCIEAAFLNGMQTPVVERAEANFQNLGIRFRSWIDYGIALEEARGGVMSAGA
jgi:hypothetical protein